jgi:hypothetical protein
MPKKRTYVGDDLGMKGGGCYAWLAFENVGTNYKAPFKIGYTMDFKKRTEPYLTSHPLGVYFVAFLEKPRIPNITNKKAYIRIEKFISERIVELGGKRVISTSRPKKNIDENGRGETEFIYCNVKKIHDAFKEAQELYGGTFVPLNLRDAKREIARKKDPANHVYTGEVIYTKEDIR